MYRNEFQYELKLWTDDESRPLDTLSVDPDFVPAAEAVRFEAVRSGILNLESDATAITVEPTFVPRLGAHRVRGFRTVMRTTAAEDTPVVASLDFPLEYFTPLARAAASTLVDRGMLERGDTYYYGVCARPREAVERRSGGLVIEEVEPPLTMQRRELRELVQRSLLVGEVAEDDPPLFVHYDVLQDAALLAREGGANEVGAILAGHVCHDPSVPDAFVEVTALIPLPCPEPELTRFRFTPETWTAARNALEDRGGGEEMVGWLHSHRFNHEICNDCSRSARKKCGAAVPFLSIEDCHLHRLVFPRAHSVALLVNDAPCAGLSITAFGWRGGRIVRRAYHVLNMPMGSAAADIDAAYAKEG